MQIQKITREDFMDAAYSRTDEFMTAIDEPTCFVVKRFYDPAMILELRRSAHACGLRTAASWHPLKDDCPDYHRLHNDYPKAHVKAKMHAFYYHGWFQRNRGLFQDYSEIFALKNHLGGYERNAFVSNRPSAGTVARICVHNYPVGGGYQAEHIDPVTPFAKLQTIIQASEIGKDYKTGGVFFRKKLGAEKVYVDEHTEPGDLILLSPGIPHGVDPVDPDEEYQWRTNTGRWMIMPIMLYSDYSGIAVQRPKQLGRQAG